MNVLMTLDAWLTLLVTGAAVYGMARGLVPPAVAMLGGPIILLLVGVMGPEQAFSGFANPAPLTIAALYIVAGAVSKSGAIQPLTGRMLRIGDTESAMLRRLLPPVAGASSFLNNTPIVAVMVPEVSAWASRHGRAVSRFLMPISFAAILGGTVTLIGTSTTLVLSGLLESSGADPLAFFEITIIGLPIAIVGVFLLTLLAPRLLADRQNIEDDLTDLAREFVVDMVVSVSGELDGITVHRAGLRQLEGVFLVQIERGGDTIAPVSPETRLQGGDRLRFAGKADNVVDLHAMPGLSSGEEAQFAGFDLSRSYFFEAVVGTSSPLIGKTLRDSQFRSRYQAAVVAIHRAGQRLDLKLGDVRLRIGDTLVVLGDRRFRDRHRERRDFLLIAPLGHSQAPATEHRVPVVIITGAVIVTAASGLMPILNASLLGVLVLLGLRIMSPGEARNAIDLDVILLIAGGIGLAEAMTSSGLASTLASGLVNTLGQLGPIGALVGVVLAALLLTEAVSNVAAAAIMFPIALATATSLGSDPRGFTIAIALVASASFLTPVGYQTNTMVYGPGGYRYTDYARLGAPLTGLVLVATLVGVPLLWSI